LKSGRLDSGMGFESLIGAILVVHRIDFATFEGKEWTHRESEFLFIGNLTDTEKLFLVILIMKVNMETEIGIRLRSLLDGLLNSAMDFTDHKLRNQLIDKIEEEIDNCEWMELSDGTAYNKVFVPTYFKEQEAEELLYRRLNVQEEKDFRQWARDNYVPHGPIENLWHPVIKEECDKINQEKL
jgi:hypothetical protein